jgi:hypothetical protein
MLSFIRSEPVAAQAVVQAGLALVCAFGAHLTVEQIGATLAFSAAVLGLITRQLVSPVGKAPPQ